MVDLKRNSARNEPSKRSQTNRLLVVSSGPLLGPQIARLFRPPSAPFLLSISVPVPTPCFFVETFFQLQLFPDHMEWSFIDVSVQISLHQINSLRTTVLASFPAGGRSVGTFRSAILFQRSGSHPVSCFEICADDGHCLSPVGFLFRSIARPPFALSHM